MRIFIALLTIGASAYAAEPWAKEPDSYRGILLGAPFVDAAPIMKSVSFCICRNGPDDEYSECEKRAAKPDEPSPTDRICRANFAVGDVRIEDTMSFRGGALSGASWSFDSDDYAVLRTVFIEKYGPPHKKEESELSNRMGAKFQQEELEWHGPNVSWSIRRYGSDLTKGSANMMTGAEKAALAKEVAAKAAKGVKDF